MAITFLTLLQQRSLSQVVARDTGIVLVADRSGRLRSASYSAEAVLGDTQSQTILHLLDLYTADPERSFDTLMATCRTQGQAEKIIRHQGGVCKLVVREFFGHLYWWQIEEPVEDISHPALDRLRLSVVEVEPDGRISWSNRRARTVFGLPDDNLAKSLATVPRSGVVRLLPSLQGAVECHITRQSLDKRRLRFTVGEILRSNENARLEFLETVPLPIAQITLSGEMTWANQKARELLSTPRHFPLQLDHLLVSDGSMVSAWLGSLSPRDKRTHSRIFTLRNHPGDGYVQVSLSLANQDGTTVAMVVFSDATEHKAMEAQFVQGQKMQAIGQLAGGIAHDFNNLLTAISGHCDLLLLRHDQGDEDYGDLVQINQNANRAAALVTQLLAFSRKQAMNPEVLDLRDTLSDLTHLLNRLVGEKTSLTLIHDPALQPIRADKRKMEQVMMNLVVNARDAMPNGGEIRIETRNLSLPHPVERQRATIPAGTYVQLDVSDEGSGIAAEDLSKIFEPFFTTKRTGEGTGLGLSTVYGIVKQTDGFIFAESEPKRGTRFTLLFPTTEEIKAADLPVSDNLIDLRTVAPRASRNPRPETQDSQDAPGKIGVSGVVLLVEDEAPVRAFAVRALRLRGLTVLEADSGEAALALLEDPDLHVDAFVTDVVMPGLDGPSWVRLACEARPDVRVVFMSGYTEAALEGDGLNVAEAVFLPKPFSLDKLTKTVLDQLSRSPEDKAHLP